MGVNDVTTFALLQWCHRLSAMERRVGSVPDGHNLYFNGATAFRRWKGRTGRRSGARSRNFNGATAFRRWKVPQFEGCMAAASLLQWCHRLSAMERGSNLARAAVAAPLQWCHRLSAMERARPYEDLVIIPNFNGATAFRRWKALSQQLTPMLKTYFNGATAFRRWKAE